MRTKTLCIGVCLAVIILVTGCISAEADEYRHNIWGMSGGEGRRYSTGSKMATKLSPMWDIRLVNSMAWTNLVSDGEFVYALINGSEGYEVVKIRTESGGVVVSGDDPLMMMLRSLLGYDMTVSSTETVFRDVPDDVSFQLTLQNGILTLLCQTEIIAIDVGNMQALWREKTRTNSIESITATGNLIICTTTDSRVEAVMARTGMPVWEQSLDKNYDYQFITANERIVLTYGFSKGDGVSMTVALNTTNGNVLWNHESDGVATKPPQIAGGNAYIAESGKFSCLDLRDGRLKWSPMFTESSDEPSEEDNKVNADKEDVTPKEENRKAKIIITPALSDDYAIIAVDGKLRLIDMQTGRTDGQIDLPEDVIPKYVLASDNHIYLVVDGEPFMYQYNMATLELERRFVGGEREVISAMIGEVIILQTRESIVCYGSE